MKTIKECKPCQCGCGNLTNHPNARFINGHWLKVKSNREKLPQSVPFSKMSSEDYMNHCARQSETMQGNIRWKNSKGFTGKTHNKNARESQRRSIYEQGLPGSRDPNCGRGKTGIRTIGGQEIWFRSTWEANFARYLHYKNIKFIFEPRTFRVTNEGEETTYLVDFYIPSKDVYYEVKGYVTDKAISYIKQVRNQGFKIYMIDIRWYKKIESKYKDLIKDWES